MKPIIFSILFSLCPFTNLFSQPSTRMFRGNAQLNGQSSEKPIYRLSGVAFTFKTAGTVRSSAVVSEGTVFLGSNDGIFYAVDSQNGKERWRLNVGSTISSSPAVAAGIVYFVGGDNMLYAAGQNTGKIVWTYSLGKDISNENYWDYYYSSPVIAGGKLFVGSGDGNIYAFDLSSRKLLWKFNAESKVRASVAVSGDILVFGTKGGTVMAVEKNSGKLLWKFNTSGVDIKFEDFNNDRTSVYCSPAVDENNVVIGGRDGFAYILDIHTGKEKWKFNHDGSWVLSTACKDGIGYIGSGSSAFVQAVDLNTGKEVWRFKTISAVFSSITIAENLLYFADFSGNIFAVDRLSGKKKWCYPIGSRVLTTPVISKGMIYAGADNGAFYALKGAVTSDTSSLRGRKAVYYQGVKSPDAQRWFVFGVDEYIRNYFESSGYELLDSLQLKQFMQDQLTSPDPGVIVFSDNKIPQSVAETPTPNALIRRFLDAGGKVVLLGNNPLAFVTDSKTGAQKKMDWSIPANVFGDHFTKLKEVQGFYGGKPTPEGERLGLRELPISFTATEPSMVSTVLAVNEFGKASAWIQKYNKKEGTGLLQFSLQRTFVGSELFSLRAAIEYGIGW